MKVALVVVLMLGAALGLFSLEVWLENRRRR